ncbi:Alpha-N-acetylglucosaminidase, partial [Cucurbita argyrosperma subsp. sororia]
MIHKFSGNVRMYAILDSIASGPIEARCSPYSTVVGMGVSMKGIEQNPVVYDLVSEMAFQRNKADVKQRFSEPESLNRSVKSMAGNGSYDWADQWDYSDSKDVVTENTKKSGGGNTTTKYKQKVGEGLGKTKAVASNGVKKVKEGTSLGFQWIKDKYNKTAHKK